MKENKSKRGGARPGAGRPLTGAAKRVPISCRVTPETAERIRQFKAEKDFALGRFLDGLFAAE